jgi:hypothetical protein
VKSKESKREELHPTLVEFQREFSELSLEKGLGLTHAEHILYH